MAVGVIGRIFGMIGEEVVRKQAEASRENQKFGNKQLQYGFNDEQEACEKHEMLIRDKLLRMKEGVDVPARLRKAILPLLLCMGLLAGLCGWIEKWPIITSIYFAIISGTSVRAPSQPRISFLSAALVLAESKSIRAEEGHSVRHIMTHDIADRLW